MGALLIANPPISGLTKNWRIAERPVFNPSRHGPFFPCHVTASGHIEPGSSGHMRPGYETAYPFYPPPHCSFRRALNTVSIDTISFNIVYIACQVGNYI